VKENQVERKSELPEVGSTTPYLVLLESHRDESNRALGTWYVRYGDRVEGGLLTPRSFHLAGGFAA